MQNLANRVGLQKASLYMRFPNKEALVPEVLNLTLSETFDHLDVEGAEWGRCVCGGCSIDRQQPYRSQTLRGFAPRLRGRR